VTTGIRCLAGGDHAVELDTAGNDEASRLAADVNELSRRLREADAARAALDRERKELTAAISHDLRTPLASIRAMTEALADGLVEDGQQARYHAGIRREVGRLDRMLDDLFDLARSDAGALELHRQVLPLQEVVADVVDAMQPQALERGVALSLASEGEPPPLAFDPSRIERVLANLVRNALEHTACGGSVSVVVRGCPTGAEVEVTDDGEGIDPADLPRIWERFYRGEKSRNRGGRADGAGLGLASVRAVVEAHGGAVAASSSPGRGSTFSIRLPA
jgi:signal transduction histidine kinase